MLVTTSADRSAFIWKTSDFSLKQELKDERQRWVWDTAFSNDSEHLLTGIIRNVYRKLELWLIYVKNTYGLSYWHQLLAGIRCSLIIVSNTKTGG